MTGTEPSLITPLPPGTGLGRMALLAAAFLAIALTGSGPTQATALPPAAWNKGAHHFGAGSAAQPAEHKDSLRRSVKPARPIWPQGYYLHDARGWIRLAKNQSYPRLVFAHPKKGWRKFIRLLPNLTLAALLKDHAAQSRLLQVSGMVTAYKGKNYLLLDANVTFPSPPAPSLPKKSPTTKKTVPQFSRRTPPNPKKLIHSLLQHHISQPVGLTAPAPASTVRPPLPTPAAHRDNPWTALPEGTYIWNQRGRLLKNPATRQWLFVFTSDGPGPGFPPIILLPCRRLAMMETQNNGPDGGKPFIISGKITEYHHHNYLLLIAAQRFFLLDRF